MLAGLSASSMDAEERSTEISMEELAALVEEVTRDDVMSAAGGIVCDCVYLLKGTEAAADDK